jgi:predicted MFS family arabinose efflux permease
VLALFAAGLAAAMHFAKLAPIMDAVAGDFGLTLVVAGLSISILGMVGIVFAISAGALVAAMGLKRSILVALYGGVGLALTSALAPEAWSFLTSRLLEGFSHLVIVICAPALMANYATPRDKPIALALWGCFFGLGFALTSAVAPSIVVPWGWRGLLAAHVAVMAGVAVLVHWAMARSHTGLVEPRYPWPHLGALLAAHRDVYASGAPLLLAMVFGTYAILFLASLTFLGRYLMEARGWPLADASAFMALAALVPLVATLLAGVLVRQGVGLMAGFLAAFGLIGFCAIGIYVLEPSPTVLQALIIIMMAAFGLLPGFCFANIPKVAPGDAKAALAYSAIAQFGNVGTFIGTPLFAWCFTIGGWPGGASFVVFFAGLGAILAMLLQRSKHRA